MAFLKYLKEISSDNGMTPAEYDYKAQHENDYDSRMAYEDIAEVVKKILGKKEINSDVNALAMEVVDFIYHKFENN